MHNNPKMPASEKDEIVTTSAQKELKNVLFHSGVLEDIGQKFCNSNYQSMFNAPKVKNVEIKKYQLIDNQYYAFEVFLEYFNCQQKNVRRRYSNFLLLSQYLQFKFREIIQPPMPPKHGLCQQYFDYHNEDILKERKIGLQKYLKDILMYEEIQNNKYVVQFLDEGIGDDIFKLRIGTKIKHLVENRQLEYFET